MEAKRSRKEKRKRKRKGAYHGRKTCYAGEQIQEVSQGFFSVQATRFINKRSSPHFTSSIITRCSMFPNNNPTTTGAWQKLELQFLTLQATHMRELFSDDP